MSNDRLKINVATTGIADRSKRRRRGPNPIAIGGAVATGLVLVGAALYGLREGDQPEVSASGRENTTSRSEARDREAESEFEERRVRDWLIEDDGKTLWISPTAGAPLDLQYVPLGTKLILHVRPAAIFSHPEGEKVFAALGPWGELAADQVERFSGAKLQEVSSLLLVFYPLENGELGHALRLRLIEPWTNEELSQRLTGSQEAIYAKQPCRVVGNRVCFLPLSESGGTLIICPASDAAELVSGGANSPPLPRDLQRVVDHSDADRMATLVLPTMFFRTSGHSLLRGTAKPIGDALQQLVGEDATVVALSAHWDDHFFFELQSTVAFGNQPHRFLKSLAERLSNLPEALAETIGNGMVHPYGREVLDRLPAMLGQLSNYTRVGTEQRVSVARCYLPDVAGHNLLTAVELMLNFSPTKEPAQLAATGSDTSTTGPPQSISERLRRRTTLSFPKETLQKALELLAKDIGVAIELQGRDLQLEGITKNQSFAIDRRDRRAGAILLAILELANPDRTASGPADSKQKLVYLIREATDGDSGAIVVTTRAAAEKRGETLPDVFMSAGP